VIEFGNIVLSRPTITESDGSIEALMPRDARLRNLTYSSPIYLEMRKVTKVSRAAQEGGVPIWNDEDVQVPFQRILLGRIPIMIKSQYCCLRGLTDDELSRVGECPLDDGGYFIVTGSEKVLIAQERMAANYVYVFPKSSPATFTHMAEIRSQSRSRHMATLYMKLMAARSGEKGVLGQPVRVSLPYIKVDVPVIIVFRALGFLDDSLLLGWLTSEKPDYLSLATASFEEAEETREIEACLEFIGRRSMNTLTTRDRRIRYARDILARELLPHLDDAEEKARYLCYMMRRMFGVARGEQPPDDRDHFGKKRLDMAGTLLCGMFRSLLKKVTKDLYKCLQKVRSTEVLWHSA